MRKGAAADFFTLFSAKRSYSPLKKAHSKYRKRAPKVLQKDA